MNDIMHLEFCWLGVFVALHPGLNLSLVSCNRCIIGLISWWLQIKIACILYPILCCTTYRHNSWMLTPFHVFPALYAGSPVTDCFTVSWDLFIPLHSSFHHLPVWGEQAGSVCSLGPARAEDAALNMLAVSFFHLAYALLMALCPEFLGYSWPHLWPLRRHKHSFPHHLWDLSKFFFFSFEHFAKILRIWETPQLRNHSYYWRWWSHLGFCWERALSNPSSLLLTSFEALKLPQGKNH